MSARLARCVRWVERAEGSRREDRPAVIPVNMFFSSLVVQEFMGRIHPFRNAPNRSYSIVRGNLTEPYLVNEPDGDSCGILRRHVGRGDVEPLLERPDLS